MNFFEFGDKSKKIIIFIHGFQLPWQVWNKYIDYYKNDFHIIIPVISGHAQETKENFISFEKDAKEIEEYVISNYGKEIFAIYGMSMGGVLTAVLWQNQKLHFENIIFDGSPLVAVNSMVKKFMTKFYLNVTHKTQQRDEKTLKKAVGNIISKENFDEFIQVLDNMSDETIKNSIDGIANFKLKKNIPMTDTKVFYFHGTSMNEMIAKKSGKYLKKYYPRAVVKCFKGKFHCENVIFDHKIMLDELDKILK